MTGKRRLEIEAEVAQEFVHMAAPYGGILEAGKTVKLNSDVAQRHAAACKEAEQHKDKNGRVNPAVQAIYARMYGLI